MSHHRHFGIRFAPVAPVSSASAGATGRDSQVAPAHKSQTVPASPKGAIWRSPARPSAVTRADSIELGAPFKAVSVSRSRDLGPRNDRASLIPMPSRSIQTGGDPLKSRNMSDAARDRVAMAFFLGVLCGICALALFAWGVVLSFVG